MLNAKFWSLWGDSLYDDWDSWLEENNIKKMRDNSESSMICTKYGVKVTERHICCFNLRFHILPGETHSLLLVPCEFAEKACILGFLP